MFLALPLSLLAFSTPAVVGVPLALNHTHTERATHATSLILNRETAIALSPFSSGPCGTYTGQLVMQPDQGNNGKGLTIHHQGRQLLIDFTLTPYYSAVVRRCPTDAPALLFGQLSYLDTLLYYKRGGLETTGLDARGRRSAIIPEVLDEYGPYVYYFDEFGDLIRIIQPPQAIVPLDSAGQLSFGSDSDSVTGRGFEGLTISSDGNMLYALLQSASVQDGGSEKKTSCYTRLVAHQEKPPALARDNARIN
ncbi:hypothetical protein H4582DRAFT_2055239 [Lactarius indigo]|nr:hypothetical protein H4582DRAFT_2055239 [Lactarius indigo]